MRLCALSVDLDEIDNYRALHGLPQLPAERPIYATALPRLVELARELQLPLTLFAIGRDLEHVEARQQLQTAARAGHLVENHSYGHHYDLSRRSAAVIEADLRRAQNAIERCTGRLPRGFRAPGYIGSKALAQALTRVGFAFDASPLPSPLYQAAKLTKIAALRLAGRHTAAVVDTPRSAFGSRRPQRLSGGIWSLPMAVTRRLRLPLIGTSLSLAGPRGAPLLVRGCVDLPLLSLELHGIDLLDARDGLADLAPHQPDVRVPLARKRGVLVAAVAQLRAAGYRFVTLARAGELLSSQ